jgi:hypothetical protein
VGTNSLLTGAQRPFARHVADDGVLAGDVRATVKESTPIFQRGDTLSVLELFFVPEHRGGGLADGLLDRPL